MFHGFIGMVQGSNPPYGVIKYGTYTIVKYCTVRYIIEPCSTVRCRGVESEIGNTTHVP